MTAPRCVDCGAHAIATRDSAPRCADHAYAPGQGPIAPDAPKPPPSPKPSRKPTSAPLRRRPRRPAAPPKTNQKRAGAPKRAARSSKS